MSDTARMVAFVRARLDEDAAIAAAATQETTGRWTARETEWDAGPTIEDDCGALILPTTHNATHYPHIARHHPARTLRRIAVQRELLDAYAEVADLDIPGYDYPHGRAAGLGLAVRQMAREHEDHPDYRPAWSQGFAG